MAAIGYTYSGGRLSQLDRKTYRSGTAQHQYYNFAYNVWGQTTATKVGSRTLSTNTYYNYVNDDTARGGNLKSTTYANGDSVSYTYDRFDRLVRKSYNSGSYVAYTYNAEGSLARLSYGDSTGELASYRFEYDSLGRLIRSAELDADGGTVQRTEHIYDGYNRLSRQSWTLGGKTYSESYVYDDPSDTNQNGDGASDTNKNGDGALTQMTTATGAVIDYQYDTLRRLTRSKVALNGSTVYTTAYAFRDLDASRTTTQVQYRNVRNANGGVLEGKKYTYDALGNITRISQSTGHFYPLVAYEYDAQNQLTKETYYNGEGTAEGNITRTISYTYDTAGNILSETKTVGSKTTTKTFSYTDSNWKDLLTGIDDQKLVYDASGNPTTYRNGTSVYYDMEWVNGRQLSFVECYYGSQSRSYYSYDASGIRSEKIVEMPGEVISYSYITQSGKVIRETVDDDHSIAILDFVYDESGKPFAMIDQRSAQPKTYYYVLNLQGDVVKLIDQDGAVAASYEYDAWGNILSQSGSMADVNPLRYRGYYYDSETGFYYLQSRYYDPATRRFINADALASTGQGFIGYNMFAYCNNSPVNTCDSDGRDAIWILEGQSAEGAGHVGLLVQDERGSWYYFYWGPQSETASISLLTGTSSAPVFERIDTGGRSFKITGNIMAALKGSENARVSERALKITRSYYYKGDYIKTYEYCKSVAKVSDDYNLITYNCVQVTCDALAQSDRRFSIKTLIPNIATNRVAYWADVPGGRVTAWSYYSRTHNSDAIK